MARGGEHQESENQRSSSLIRAKRGAVLEGYGHADLSGFTKDTGDQPGVVLLGLGTRGFSTQSGAGTCVFQ